MTITARNVNEALYLGVNYMKAYAKSYPSRNGEMLEAPIPIMTLYKRPQERVLFYAARDANPLFHFFESLWMLAGRNDLKFVTQFVKNMKNFSDDGKTLNGSAYGKRWRSWWQKEGVSIDQLETVIELLKKNPMDRRIVLQMWDPAADLANEESKDLPCNTAVYFKARDGHLHMTVSNRSNDVIWGAYGANAVHFSVLLEYVAGRVGLKVGTYTQFSNSYHIYTDNPFWKLVKDKHMALVDPYDYDGNRVFPFPMFDGSEDDRKNFDLDLALFFEDPQSNGFQTKFFSSVVKPLWHTHLAYKEKNFEVAFEILEQCRAEDWKKAVREWLERRNATQTEGGE